MLRLLIIVNLIFFSIPAFAELAKVNHSLIFQVIQDEFVLDNSTIKSASIIEDEGVYKGLHVELKPESSGVLTEMTKAGMGKRLSLILNNRIVFSSVIQTSLGSNLLVTGIAKQDAQDFLNMLNANKPKKEE